MSYDVETIEEVPRLIAATKLHTIRRRIGSDIGAGFGSLMQVLGQEGVSVSGPPLIVYHGVIDEETGGDIEICVPVDSEISGESDVYGRELEGGTMATTVHSGRYEEIAPAYHTLTGWISEHGYEIAGPPPGDLPQRSPDYFPRRPPHPGRVSDLHRDQLTGHPRAAACATFGLQWAHG